MAAERSDAAQTQHALRQLRTMAEGLAGNREHVLMLNDYQVANLSALFQAIGYGYADPEGVQPGPLGVANTGDWLGELYQMLPYVEQEPNVEPGQLRRQAAAWGRNG